MTTVKAFIRTGKKDKEVMSDFDYLMDAMYSYSTNQILWSLLLFGMPRLKNIRLKVL